MSMARADDMTALVGSRICHDLISPLGAIGNGLELLQMTGAADSPEMALVSDSVASAAARVKLFRLAFGAACREHMIAEAEMQDHAQQLGHGRFSAAWSSGGDTDRATAKLGLLLLLCAETLLPYGGEARVEAAPDRVALRMTAPRMREPEPFLAQLTHADAPAPTAAEVHFPLARLAAADLGRSVEIARAPGRLEITV